MATLDPKISARIVALMEAGADLRTAYDAVLGVGAYDRLAAEMYESLRGGKR